MEVERRIGMCEWEGLIRKKQIEEERWLNGAG
jgi:hypothetical protein